jgi:hypothetical protein
LNFEKDIFISYAHIDDESISESEKGWITEFHRALEIRLSQLLGERPNIWRDSALDGNHDYDKEIVSQFPKIAILISILSPRYVKSEWCVKEVDEFYKAADQNLGPLVNNKSRVFKVVKTPVELEKHPEKLQALLGYDFFQVDQDNNRVREYSKLYGDKLQQMYWAKLDDVAHDISALLSEMKEMQSNESTENKKGKRFVYLAETTYDSKEQRAEIKRWLEDHNFTVFPNQNLSLIAQEYNEQVAEIMAKCELSIHILGPSFGIVPEGTISSKNILQINQAITQPDVNSIIWVANNLTSDDDRQSAYLEELKAGNETTNNAEFVIATIEELKFVIEDKLVQKEPEKEPEKENSDPALGDDTPPMVYLICDEHDLDNIVEIEDFLYDKGFEVIIPVFEGEQADIRLDHQENLKSCDAVIIYYGAGNDLWIRAKSRELLKIAGYGRTTPLNHKAVILAPEKTTSKQRFRSRDLSVINFLESQNLDLLEELSTKILNQK